MDNPIVPVRYWVDAGGQKSYHASFREALVTAVLHPNESEVSICDPPEWFKTCAGYVLRKEYAPILIYALGNQGSADHFGMARQAVELVLPGEQFALPVEFGVEAGFMFGGNAYSSIPDLCCDVLLSGAYEDVGSVDLTFASDLGRAQWELVMRALRQYGSDTLRSDFIRFVNTITDNPVSSMIDALLDVVSNG